ncbi:MAG TPA: lytic transglycosylase domain-containing protein [Pyrinomonadaceae bacterium]|nr:lytic transglycosylase domain-containing protein [Pyrinomonadaceae bacterium]
MKFPRKLPHFRSLKFAPFVILSLFLFTNFTGILFSRVMAPVAVANPAMPAPIPADIPTSGDPQLDQLIYDVGQREGVDPRFIHAVIWQESKYIVDARSHAGAQGLMQLMPATAKRFGCEDPHNPAENIEAGTKYLHWLLKRFSGNVELALAGYNAGEGAVDKYNGIPPYNETRNYVQIISKRYGKTFHPIDSPSESSQAD